MPELSIIVAVAQNGVIGHAGKLPWHLPSDLRHFKRLTMGYPLIMGRKTYESIGRPLPGRENLVLTRDPALSIPGCRCFTSFQEALDYCHDREKVFVIGGGDIFTIALPYTDIIIVTALDREVEGDVFFPPIDPGHFRIVDTMICNEEETYSIIRYERIRV